MRSALRPNLRLPHPVAAHERILRSPSAAELLHRDVPAPPFQHTGTAGFNLAGIIYFTKPSVENKGSSESIPQFGRLSIFNSKKIPF
jgi:hypothetical protein